MVRIASGAPIDASFLRRAQIWALRTLVCACASNSPHQEQYELAGDDATGVAGQHGDNVELGLCEVGAGIASFDGQRFTVQLEIGVAT